ncbi:glycosyltransferase family protein [Kordiimonas aestuarii]|uniref:hypothetical protein n=1 Tax=Kordiimonas aestuarii TaxID=1005925 RepID=UPI0021CEB4B3|nr:hypothetical protein [Kordiimonas aestuarii]
MAKVYICDPGLTSHAGHHARWDACFAALFTEKGYKTTIFSHGNFQDATLDGVPVVRHFTKTSWHTDSRRDLLKNWDKYFDMNRVMFEELARLFVGSHLTADNLHGGPGDRIEPDDILIFPTILQYQLTGVVRWFCALPEAERPTVICYLMGPSGCLVDTARQKIQIDSFDTARFYKLAFRELESEPAGMHFFACGSDHAEQYSYLRGKPVPTYPILATAVQPYAPLREQPARQVLLHAGAPRNEKGSFFLQDIAAGLCSRHEDWTFVVQVGWPQDDVSAEPAHGALSALDRVHENFSYSSRLQETDPYCALFNDSEIVLVPYHAGVYFNRSSGIVWEAIATANILVVPENCWLAREAARLGAAYVTFGEFSARAMLEAVTCAIEDPPMNRKERLRLARAFKAENRPEKLASQIFECWQPAPECETVSVG